MISSKNINPTFPKMYVRGNEFEEINLVRSTIGENKIKNEIEQLTEDDWEDIRTQREIADVYKEMSQLKERMSTLNQKLKRKQREIERLRMKRAMKYTAIKTARKMRKLMKRQVLIDLTLDDDDDNKTVVDSDDEVLEDTSRLFPSVDEILGQN